MQILLILLIDLLIIEKEIPQSKLINLWKGFSLQKIKITE